MYQAVIVDDESFVLDGMRTAIDWSGFNFELCCCTTNSSQTYFNRQFKRKYGAAPNAYRREMKLKNL